MRASRAVFAVAVAGGVLTAAVAFVPGQRTAYRAEQLHVAIETAATLVAVLVAFLVFERARRSRRVADELLLTALVALALTNLLLTTLPLVIGEADARFGTWAALFGQAAAAAVLLGAAFARRRAVRPLPPWAAPAAGCALVALDLVVVAFVRPRLPQAVSVLPPALGKSPQLVSHPAALATQIVIGACYGLATVGFTIRAERRDDSFVSWLAVGTVLAALSRVNYILYPSLYSEWAYTGDFFRLAFYAVLLIGALQEIATYWRAASEAAVLEERRRIARDLHDGLAQEVAYITRASKVLRDREHADDLPERLVAAAERAFQESRQVIATLAAPAGEPLAAVLERVARDAAARFGVAVDVDVPPAVTLDSTRTEALVRITGEAVANAARHSGATLVLVALERRRDRLFLRVSDDGSGFDPSRSVAGAGGFGLSSMRERAAAVGAEFRLRTSPGAGTRVEVSF